MSGAPIEFYFDFVSHNAYVAWTQLPALAARHGRTVELVPVLFAGMLEANGQRGPAEIAPKRDWMIRDLLRKAALLGVPLEPPASHPFNPLVALRAVSQPLADDARAALTDALFRAAWCEGRALDDAAVVADVASRVGLDGPAVVARCADPDVKERLRARTEAAIRAGVFGVPSMRADGELFWGYDDFGHLDLFLRGLDPLPHARLDAWARVRPSATRKPR
jgi:2-hydroxychromene-2-carboxylate isomerase